MSYRGIDLSNANGTVDFATAKANGLQFCIARCGYGEDLASQDDGQFARNYSQCKSLGIPIGSYFYTYAMTVADTESEKSHIRRLLAGKSFDLPVFVDMEDADGYKARHGGIPGRQTNTDIIQSLCDYIASLGFQTGYYSNKDWSENHIYPDQLSYDFWYARPGLSQPDRSCDVWQDEIGETGGHFPGVKNNAAGSCDTDICIKEYFDSPNPPVQNVDVYYRVRTQADGWLPEVRNLTDYAGYRDSAVTDITVRVTAGSVKYRVHVKGGSWLPFVTGCNINDGNNGYAGEGVPIDAVEVYYNTPAAITPYKRAKYRVAPVGGDYYSWQYDDETSGGQDGYAGCFGYTIGKLQIVIE